jgi:hypothetical protein
MLQFYQRNRYVTRFHVHSTFWAILMTLCYVTYNSVARLRAGRSEFNSWMRQRVRIGFGANPASCSMGPGVLSSEVKRPGCEASHLRPYSAEVTNM